MPALLVQKPSRASKSKDHLKSLESRLNLWEEGNFSSLETSVVHEGETIQKRIKVSEKGVNIDKILLKFKNLLSKGNVNRTLKLLTGIW